MNKNIKAFTLIELLVVISIIAVLAGLLLPNFVSSRERARDAQRKHDLLEIKNALRLYYNDNQEYPAVATFSFGYSWGDYMSLVPQDPLYDEVSGDYSYNYCRGTTGEGFVVCSQLENAGDSDARTSQGGSCPTTICNCNCGGSVCYYVCAN